jgi:prepilin-type N-terminal cleavage/methylation domain-containing protein
MNGTIKVLMDKKYQAGFTLVELILAVAISSALVMIAFTGQRELRARAQFDAAIENVVSSIATAHTQATAGINVAGPGDGSINCGAVPSGMGAPKYVFAGVGWSVVDGGSGAAFQMDYYAARRTGVSPTACVFDSQTISIPSGLSTVPTPLTSRVLFVRDDFGGLNICQSSGPASDVLASFQAGICAGAATPGAVTLTLSDPAEGFVSHVGVEESGLAKRID